ncbi:MAG: bacteriophage holin [Candidatus Marinimicrobia bacterium]|nr:bacteriophage holin [Candidatus Neomarinimicrobiota bacterium]
MKLNTKAFALTCGLVWGFGVFFLTWWVIAFEGSSTGVTFLGHVYRGYTISAAGSIVGLIWGLVDGAIGGAILSWLYNLLLPKFTAESA